MPFTAQDPELGFCDIADIKRLIPHRYPFLLIDRVMNVDLNKGAVGLKNVTVNEPFFPGHFPVQPVMPGVMIVEAMAQTSAVLVSKSLNMQDSNMLVYFMMLDKTRFRQPVVPGDQLELHVSVIRGGSKTWKFWGEAKVEGKTVTEAEFTAMIRPPDSNASA